MTETKVKRRAWVKNAAIIFLAVLLVLTFFSNSILNRSLPEVAAQYPTSGTIELKIRGSGAVSANQTQKVSIGESRKVKGIAIRVGDEVTEGQALFLLAETDSEELTTAKQQLEEMELAYEKALLDQNVYDSGSNYDILSAQITLQDAIERRDKAKVYDEKREPLEAAVNTANQQLNDATNSVALLPEKGFLDQANEQLEKAKAAQTKATEDFNYYAELSGVGDYGSLVDKLETLTEELDEQYYKLEYHNFLSTIREAVDSIVHSARPAQQIEEIEGQYKAAKAAWDALTAVAYYECVDVEAYHKNFDFHALGASLAGYNYDSVSDYESGVLSFNPRTEQFDLINGMDDKVLVFDTNTGFSSDGAALKEIYEMFGLGQTPPATDSDEAIASDGDAETRLDFTSKDHTAALTWVYRSMIWWGETSDAASEYVKILEEIETKEDEYNDTIRDLDNPNLQNAYDEVLAANEAVKLANDDVYQAQLRYDEAAKTPNANVEAAQKKLDDAKKQLELLEGEYEGIGSYADEQKNVISAEKALSTLYSSQAQQNVEDQKEDLDLQRQKEQLDKQRALVEDLEENASETIIYAPCSGTVTAVNVAAGDTTVMDAAMAEIELTDQGHTLSFEVTKEQAARVNVGDQAEIDNRWGVDIRATLVSITNSKDNPGTMKVLTFDLKGEDVVAGQSLTLSVGQKSQNYEVLVPNSALREDAQGKFVLVVRSKNTPLGNRYSVDRVDVEVLASDDKNSAVKGMLTTGEFVVITSTAPLTPGDNVRLPE